MMDTTHKIWQEWAARLQRWGLEDVTAVLLEASSPLHFVGAQMVYLGQPALNGLVPGEQTRALAALLEEQQNAAAFIAILRER